MLQSRSVTIAVVIPTIFVLRRAMKNNDSDFASALFKNLEHRIVGIEETPNFVVATLLDVRFKHDFIEPERKDKAFDIFMEEAFKMLVEVTEESQKSRSPTPISREENNNGDSLSFFEKFRAS
ncbi:hypothetical protein L596_015992 [Steinernema carpocapsae]|uniref:Uncharacterized protein n=1 Tax=Steinernema carpocapsae TaxID=34508 RepID=A0A4U5NHN8_STECR|nr:hypothetical protein L596_015992 [Steinernema carpocapsae]